MFLKIATSQIASMVKSFLQYIKIAKEDNANNFADHLSFNQSKVIAPSC
jgi:hypothetical protein